MSNAAIDELRRAGVKFRGAMVEHDGWIALHGVSRVVGWPAGWRRKVERIVLCDVSGEVSECKVFRVKPRGVSKRHKSHQTHGEPF